MKIIELILKVYGALALIELILYVYFYLSFSAREDKERKRILNL